jgi:hypothetical protein
LEAAEGEAASAMHLRIGIFGRIRAAVHPRVVVTLDTGHRVCVRR